MYRNKVIFITTNASAETFYVVTIHVIEKAVFVHFRGIQNANHNYRELD
jgi:hypothetical protein